MPEGRCLKESCLLGIWGAPCCCQLGFTNPTDSTRAGLCWSLSLGDPQQCPCLGSRFAIVFFFCLFFPSAFVFDSFFFDPSWVWLGLVFFFGWSVGWFWKRKQSCLEREGWRRHLGRVRAAGPEHFSAAGEGGRGGQRDSTLLSLHSTSGSLREGISGKLNQLWSLSFTK